MVERVERKGTNSIKYDSEVVKHICGNPEAEPFWVADMDLESPKAVQEELLKMVQQKAYGYGGDPGLSQAFCDFAKRHHNLTLTPSEIVVSPGILTSISIAVQLFPGYDMIVPMPAYQPFLHIAKANGRQVHQWNLSYDREGEGFTLDMPALDKILSEPGNKLMVFCSPHNPSGRVWTHDELVAVAKACKEHDVPVLSDEIHCDLAFEGFRHIPFTEIAKETGIEAISFMAPSKTFNIAGEHMSATLFSDPERKNQFVSSLKALHSEELSIFSTAAAYACYTKGYEWLTEVRHMLAENAKFMGDFIRTQIPQLKIHMPQASFIVFIDCRYVREKIPKDMDLSHFFGEKANVCMNDGTWFGDCYGDFVRFNFGTDLDHVKAALERIRNAVNSL